MLNLCLITVIMTLKLPVSEVLFMLYYFYIYEVYIISKIFLDFQCIIVKYMYIVLC